MAGAAGTGYDPAIIEENHNMHLSCQVKVTLFALLIAFSAAGPSLGQVQQRPVEGVTFEPDVVYGKGGDVELHMDIARPSVGDGPFPAVVCIHGGAWRGGNKNRYRGLIRQLAARGYVAATVQYRLAPMHTFPAQIEDVKCAVRYLRARAAELKIDPNRIGAMGESAGGHLSLLLATTDSSAGLEGSGGHGDQSSRVQAVVNYFGPTDLALEFAPNVRPLITTFIGGGLQDKPREHKLASPVTHLTKDDPPILTLHGTVDRVVPYEQATVLDEACKKVGIPHELVPYEGVDHGFAGEHLLRALAETVKFFDAHLKGKSEG